MAINLSTEELVHIFETENLNETFIEKFQDDEITKMNLKYMTVELLKTFGIESPNDCGAIIECLAEHEILKTISKVFNDSVHGHIELNPVCVAIIDTPEFQRLRYIKQLGMSYFVYPGASHNRFEHSLGVCYLAGKFVRTLLKNQPYLEITEKDILCVEIAGLCHDIGHGPFSHVFETALKNIPGHELWKHEETSVQMFDYLVEKNNLKEGILKAYGLDDGDLIFIKDLIKKNVNDNRGEEKRFLFEIVANERNGIDVDKWDYFARDCHHLGISNSFDHRRCMKFARVYKHEEESQICFRDKELGNLSNMFHTRYMLHRMAYQHRVTKALEVMFQDAIGKAFEKQIKLPNGELASLSECIGDMNKYSQLNDNIIFDILKIQPEENDEDLNKAQEIINRIFDRKFYICVGESKPIDTSKYNLIETEIKTEIQNNLNNVEVDFVVQVVKFDYGSKDANPLLKILFYTKEKIERKYFTTNEVSKMYCPEIFSEAVVRILSPDGEMPINWNDAFQTGLEHYLESHQVQNEEQ